jgi:hypothetical protein
LRIATLAGVKTTDLSREPIEDRYTVLKGIFQQVPFKINIRLSFREFDLLLDEFQVALNYLERVVDATIWTEGEDTVDGVFQCTVRTGDAGFESLFPIVGDWYGPAGLEFKANANAERPPRLVFKL